MKAFCHTLTTPEEGSSLKRAPAEPSSSSTPAGSKAKASPVKPQKRSGELRIAAGPKLKVQPPQGEKREPEVSVEDLRDQTGEPPAGATTPGQPPDAGGLSLSRAKKVVKRMIKRRIKQVYEQQEVDISSVGIETLANIGCEQCTVQHDSLTRRAGLV